MTSLAINSHRGAPAAGRACALRVLHFPAAKVEVGGGRGHCGTGQDGMGHDRAWTPPPPRRPCPAPAEALTTLGVHVCDPAQHRGCFVRPQPAGPVLQRWHGCASLGEISVARIPAALKQPELWGWYHGAILLPCLRDADKFNFTT